MKTIFSLIAAVLFAVNIHAATVATSVIQAGTSNVVTGSLKATQFVLVSGTTSAARVDIYDSPTAVLTNTLPAYITLGSYVTNYITSYTNYFGVQNNFTNVALVQYSITNAATTNVYPLILTLTAGTNQTVVVDGVDYFFSRGLTITNTGVGTATVSATYIR
jgi:hypothetical protein